MQACLSQVASCSSKLWATLAVTICWRLRLHFSYHYSARLYYYIPNGLVRSLPSFRCHTWGASLPGIVLLYIVTFMYTPESLIPNLSPLCWLGSLCKHYCCNSDKSGQVFGQLKNVLWLHLMRSTIHSTPLSFNIMSWIAGGNALFFEQCSHQSVSARSLLIWQTV